MSASLRPGLLRTAVAVAAGITILVPLAPVAAASPAERQPLVAADFPLPLPGLPGIAPGEPNPGGGGTILDSIVKIDPSALMAEGGPDFAGILEPGEGPGLGEIIKSHLDLGDLLGRQFPPDLGDVVGGLLREILAALTGGDGSLDLGDLLRGLLSGLLGGDDQGGLGLGGLLGGGLLGGTPAQP